MSIKRSHIITASLFTITILFGVSLFSNLVSATNNTDIVDKINITVPVSCSLEGTGMNSHNANVINGTYQADIGSTTLKAFCNDSEGFAIYAAGYTGDEIGETNSTKLVNSASAANNTITTGTATSGNTSNWAMKLTTNSNATYALTLDNGFSSYSSVPNTYTKVAHRDSGTDIGTNATGASLTTTYAAFISQTQPAGTYSGQVIYTLVHPSDHSAPAVHPAILDTGQTVNAKLKSLAATVVNGYETTITPAFDPGSSDYNSTSDEYIKSISVHLETPAPTGFIPSEANTISSSASKKPIYIIFDNTNNAGIMHFYTEGDQIILPSDSSFMFYMLYALTEVSGISDWNSSNVTDMSYMFYSAGEDAATFSLDLSTWDTSNVTDMGYLFYFVGRSATTWSIGDLSTWDTSNVTDMGSMFDSAGLSATTFSLNISSWNTSNVTNMSSMFASAGYSTPTFSLDLSSWNTSNVTDMSSMFSNTGSLSTTWSIGDLSSWDTSKVTNMNRMFVGAGESATTFSLNISSWDTSNVTDMDYMFRYTGRYASTWSIIIPQTNGNNISNTTNRIYGKTTSTYGTPPNSKSFTLAQL